MLTIREQRAVLAYIKARWSDSHYLRQFVLTEEERRSRMEEAVRPTE